jgi:DNA-binding transcriptional regulator YiaG
VVSAHVCRVSVRGFAVTAAMTPQELRAIRAELGLVQLDMARELMVSLRQYKRYENAQTEIPRLRAKRARELRTRKRRRGVRKT